MTSYVYDYPRGDYQHHKRDKSSPSAKDFVVGILAVTVVSVSLYLGYRWYKDRKDKRLLEGSTVGSVTQPASSVLSVQPAAGVHSGSAVAAIGSSSSVPPQRNWLDRIGDQVRGWFSSNRDNDQTTATTSAAANNTNTSQPISAITDEQSLKTSTPVVKTTPSVITSAPKVIQATSGAAVTSPATVATAAK